MRKPKLTTPDFFYMFKFGNGILSFFPDIGNCLTKYYFDHNFSGDSDTRFNDPCINSKEYWVMDKKEYEFNVAYSNIIGILSIADVQAKFTVSEQIALRKDSADDFRACIQLKVKTLTSFVASLPNRPDPITSDADYFKHANANEDMTILSSIRYANRGFSTNGLCIINNISSMCYNWSTAINKTWIHEVGHGVGLDDIRDPNKTMMLMHEYGTASGVKLTQEEAKTYDGGK